MTAFPLPLDLEPMEAKSVDTLPAGAIWQFEPKWDGFRCLAFKSSGQVELRAKSGKSLSRYFPEMLAALAASPAGDFVLDGELVIPVGGTLSFAALQDRLHPAESRVKKLAAESPAMLVLFDCLFEHKTGSQLAAPLPERRAALERVAATIGRAHAVRLTPTPATARTHSAGSTKHTARSMAWSPNG